LRGSKFIDGKNLFGVRKSASHSITVGIHVGAGKWWLAGHSWQEHGKERKFAAL
jgi:hypothetical protein